MELERAGPDGNNGKSAERMAAKRAHWGQNGFDFALRQPRILPPQIQRDMSYCGTFITAEELYEKYGGVTQVVDQLEQLMPTAMEKARELCRRGPLVLRYLKACMNKQEALDMHRRNELEITYTRYMARHKDFEEGVKAFLEKREPHYTGG